MLPSWRVSPGRRRSATRSCRGRRSRGRRPVAADAESPDPRTSAPRTLASSGLVVPQPEPASECIHVVTEADVRRDFRHVLRVAAAEHDVVDEEGREEAIDDVEHVLSPVTRAELRAARRTDILLVRLAVAVRQVRELERNHGPVVDHRASQPGAESEEEHLAAVVAAECLHRGVVDHAHGTPEGPLEIEPDPTLAEVPRLSPRAILADG